MFRDASETPRPVGSLRTAGKNSIEGADERVWFRRLNCINAESSELLTSRLTAANDSTKEATRGLVVSALDSPGSSPAVSASQPYLLAVQNCFIADGPFDSIKINI